MPRLGQLADNIRWKKPRGVSVISRYYGISLMVWGLLPAHFAFEFFEPLVFEQVSYLLSISSSFYRLFIDFSQSIHRIIIFNNSVAVTVFWRWYWCPMHTQLASILPVMFGGTLGRYAGNMIATTTIGWPHSWQWKGAVLSVVDFDVT